MYITGVKPVDIKILSELDYKELLHTAETDTYFKNIINSNEFLSEYLTYHNYPLDIIQDKPIDMNYIDFLRDVMDIINGGISNVDIMYNRPYHYIDNEKMLKLKNNKYFNTLKYLLFDLDYKNKRIDLSSERLNIIISLNQKDVLEFVLNNLNIIMNYPMENYRSNVVAIETNNYEIFKLINDRYPVSEDRYDATIYAIIKVENSDMLDYFIKKNNLTMFRFWVNLAEREGYHKIANYIRNNYTIDESYGPGIFQI